MPEALAGILLSASEYLSSYIIGCDPGHNYAVPLLFAAKCLPLHAITTVFGKTNITNKTRNTVALASAAGLKIPVARGASRHSKMLLSGGDWDSHKIQGRTPDFIPGVLEQEAIDELLPTSDDEAIQSEQDLAAQEGIFCGISAGATMCAALKVAKIAPPERTFCVMLPDTGERYLSSRLFDNGNQFLMMNG